MTNTGPSTPIHIRLTDERRAALIQGIRAYFTESFDEDLSAFRAEGLLDFFVGEIGPAVYNQGVQDARRFIQEKLEDLEVEVYEPESHPTP